MSLSGTNITKLLSLFCLLLGKIPLGYKSEVFAHKENVHGVPEPEDFKERMEFNWDLIRNGVRQFLRVRHYLSLLKRQLEFVLLKCLFFSPMKVQSFHHCTLGMMMTLTPIAICQQWKTFLAMLPMTQASNLFYCSSLNYPWECSKYQ